MMQRMIGRADPCFTANDTVAGMGNTAGHGRAFGGDRLAAWYPLQRSSLYLLPLALLLALVSVPAAAQSGAMQAKPLSQYARDHWTVADGLPQLGADAIAQDGDGYLWFGTLGGLGRFDGTHFTNFYPSDTPALRSASINALLADGRGRLWIATPRGLAVHSDGSFDQARIQPGQPAPDDVTELALGLDGRVLVGSNRGLYVHEEGKGLRLLSATGPVAAIAATETGIWMGAQSSVYQLIGDKLTPHPLPAAPEQRLISLNVVDNQLWASSTVGVYRFDGSQWLPLTDPRVGGPRYRRLAKGEHNNQWLIESSRLLRLLRGQIVEEILLAPEFAHAARTLRDRDGNQWLSSANSGVMRLWPGVARHYPLQGEDITKLVWTTVRTADGHILAGGNQGVSVVRDGALQPYLHDARLSTVYTLMSEGDDLWAGTVEGLVLYRKGQRVALPELAPLRNTRINGIVRDHAGNLWIAANSGIYRLDPQRVLTHIRPSANVVSPMMRVLLVRRNGQILAGGQDGLFKIEGEHLLALPTPLSDPKILALHELPGGEVLFGTQSEEGLRLLREDGSSVHLGAGQGLPAHHTPYAITDDGQGHVLVTGFLGVYRVDEQSLLGAANDPSRQARAQMLISQNNRTHAGQRAQCCNGGGLARAFMFEQKLWAPASDGLYQIDADIDTEVHTAPSALIERVRVGEQWRSAQGDNWKLPASGRDLQFDFNVLGFNPMHLAQARYRLLGYDDQWHAPGVQDSLSAHYTNLPPGFYTFEVSGSWGGKPPESSARLSFEIQPYFHETWMFKAALAVGLLMLGGLAARLFSQWRKRRNAALETLIEQRTRELSSVNRELESLSRTDTLTGLYNRRHVSEQIPGSLAMLESHRHPRREDRVTVFALIDIDHFKAINDSFGHEAGDDVLVEVATRLSRQMRSGDYIARWGGEEFLAVLHEQPRGRYNVVAERLLGCIRDVPFQVGGASRTLTVSIGLAETPLFSSAPNLWDWEQNVALADMAMYAAKHAGRNGWAIHQPVDPAAQPSAEASPRLLVARGDLVILHSARD